MGDFIPDPSVIFAVILDFEKCKNGEHRCIVHEELGLYESLLSIAMPVLQADLQATALGLNTSLITPEIEKSTELLNLPEGYFCPLALGIGYELEGTFQKERIREPVEKILFYEKFGEK